MIDKEKMQDLFSSIAPKYDLLNHLLSLNIDRRWRKVLIDYARIRTGDPSLNIFSISYPHEIARSQLLTLEDIT